MSRKLLVLSSIVVAMVAVSFDTTEAQAGRCCRNRGRRCCNVGYGGCGNFGYAGCGYRGGCNTGCNMACNNGCNTGCITQVAYNNCGAIQGCGPQGCPVQGGRLMAQPNGAIATQAPPPPPAPAGEPLAPAAPTEVKPAP